MAKLVRRGLRVLPALSIVAMLVLTATLSFWNTSQAPPAFAADDSITINSTTLALQTDTETNSIADIGDTIRITVDLSNTDGGYGAAGTTVTADLQAYGGGAAENVPGITDTGGTNDIFQLDFVVLSAGGSGIDVAGNNAASAVTVTAADTDELDGTGSANPSQASNNMTEAVDTIAPLVTDGNISIAGGSGTAGAYITGDTVTVTWDAQTDGTTDVASAAADLSAFGGGAAVVMTDTVACGETNADNVWEACYTLVSGAIDGTTLNATVTATDDAGNVTGPVADTTDATVDNIAPTVTDGNISISGATGTGGAYKIGDTVTATWNNTAGGDNNTDTIAGVTVDFSAFGGGAAVVASDAADTWTATFTIVAGAIDGTTLNVSVTATDNAGNTTTTADTTDATVDSIAPTPTDANITVTKTENAGDAGVANTTDVMTVVWDAATDTDTDVVSGSADFADFGGALVALEDDGAGGTCDDTLAGDDIWCATYTLIAGAIDDTDNDVTLTLVTDDAGNVAGDVTDGTQFSVDNIAPTLTAGTLIADQTACTGTAGVCIIGDTITFTWDNSATGDNNADITLVSQVDFDLTNFGGTATETPDSVALGIFTLDFVVLAGDDDGTLSFSATVTDDGGNTAGPVASTDQAPVDNIAPTVTAVDFATTAALGITFNSVTLTYSEAITLSTDAGGDGDIVGGASAASTASMGGMTTAKTLEGIGTWDGASDMTTNAAGDNTVALNAGSTIVTVVFNTQAGSFFDSGTIAPTTPTFTPTSDATDITDDAGNPVNTAVTPVATNGTAWDVTVPTILNTYSCDTDADADIDRIQATHSENMLDSFFIEYRHRRL